MSPSIFSSQGLRFYFYSREEPRVHVHVRGPEGKAKIWLEPEVVLAQNDGLTDKTLAVAVRIAEERRDEILEAWQKHFR